MEKISKKCWASSKEELPYVHITNAYKTILEEAAAQISTISIALIFQERLQTYYEENASKTQTREETSESIRTNNK